MGAIVVRGFVNGCYCGLGFSESVLQLGKALRERISLLTGTHLKLTVSIQIQQ